MSRLIRRSALVAGLLLQGACVSGDGCGPIQRVLTTSGEIRDGRTVIATATVRVAEQQGDPHMMRVHVTGVRGTPGAPLAGHVRGARLINARNGDTVRVFRVLPPSPGGDEIIGAPTAYPDDLHAVKRMLRRRRGVLLLDTDLPGRERITVPLTRVHAGGWVRVDCG